jgi:hypothetical protein
VTFPQEVLRTVLTGRILAAGATPADAPDTTVFAVLPRLDPAAVAASAAAFTLGLDHGRAARWRRAFTRTVFLTGNPANLRHRFAFDHVSDCGRVAWIGPCPPAELTALRRLLPLVAPAPLPDLPAGIELTLPGGGPAPGPTPRRRVLCVATAGTGVADYLVHLNHVVAEAVLDGHLRGGDRLTLTHAPRLTRGSYDVLRVHADTADDTRLRAYAGLLTT